GRAPLSVVWESERLVTCCNRVEFNRLDYIGRKPFVNKIIEQFGEFSIIVAGIIAADLYADIPANLLEILNNDNKRPFAGSKGARSIMGAAGTVKGHLCSDKSQRL